MRFQVVFQILTFVVFFLLLCGTYLFKVGLVWHYLCKDLGWYGTIVFVYIGLTCIVGGMRFNHINNSGRYIGLWEIPYFTPLTIIHKLLATVYYVINVGWVLKLGHPKYYTKEPWVELYQRDSG